MSSTPRADPGLDMSGERGPGVSGLGVSVPVLGEPAARLTGLASSVSPSEPDPDPDPDPEREPFSVVGESGPPPRRRREGTAGMYG